MSDVLLKIVHTISPWWLLAGAAVFIPLERLAPHRGRQPIFRDGWLTDLSSYVGNALLFAAVVFGLRRVVPQGLGWLRPLPAPFTLHGAPAWVQAVASIAIGSLCYYWGHRALHTVPLLWRFHSVHHSIVNIDWLATYRGHVFETCWFSLIAAIPMTLFDVSTPAVTWFLVYRFVESHVEHSNVRIPLGPLRWLFPSPWFHHWHHALEPEAINRNFSPYPLWDVLFRTAYMPDRLPSGFGTDAPVPGDYPGQVAYPFGLAPLWERISDGIARVFTRGESARLSS